MTGNGFLKFADVQGTSSEPAHKGWLNITSLNYNISNAYERNFNQKNHIVFSEMTVTKQGDKYSPQIQAAVISGKIGTCMIEFTNPASQSDIVYSYTLNNAKIIHYDVSVGSDGIHKESLQFAFTDYEIKYIPYDINSKQQPALVFSCEVTNL